MLGLGTLARKVFGTPNDRKVKSVRPIVAKINALEPEFAALNDDGIKAKTAEFQKRVQQNGESLDDILPEELARVTRAADRAAELGAPHLVVGGGAKRFDGTREPDYHKLGAALDRVKALAEARGLRAHYHPHLSTIVEGPAEVAKIFDLTAIDFCPDTAHLAAAGGDPAQLIRDHASRITYVHLKGFQRAPFAFTPLDRGDVPTAPILQALRDVGFAGWVCTELDSWPDPAEGARLSMDYLNRALAG